MTDYYDYALIKQLQANLDALTERVQVLERQLEQTSVIAAHAKAQLTAMMDVLVEAGQLDAQEIAARVAAQVIARRHEVRDEMRDSQSVWDAAAPKK